MWKHLPNLEGQMDWIFHRSTIVLFIKWKRWNFQRWTECLGTSIFFCVLGLFSTSLLPSQKLFQWNDFTGIKNRICHSLEKETSLWRKSSEDVGGLTTWENIFPFMPFFFEGWMTCTLKLLFSSTSIPIADEILFTLYVTLLPKGILSNLNVFLWVPLHLTFSRHFLSWYLIWQPFCMYEILAYILLIFSQIFCLFQSCCSDFYLTLLPPSVDIRSIRFLTGCCILTTQAVLPFRSLMKFLTLFSEIWLKWPISSCKYLTHQDFKWSRRKRRKGGCRTVTQTSPSPSFEEEW